MSFGITRTIRDFQWSVFLWEHPTCAETAFPHSSSPSSLCSIYHSCHGSKQHLTPEPNNNRV